MKKILITLLIIVLIPFLLLLIFGKTTFEKKSISKPFKESNFYNKYYNTDDLILVNVWATWCKPCLEEVSALEKIDTTQNLKFVTLSIDKDTIKLKKFLAKSTFFRTKDITLDNFTSRDSILSVIDLTGASLEFLGVSMGAEVVPYSVLIKNKKIIYRNTGGEINIDSLNQIIKKNK